MKITIFVLDSNGVENEAGLSVVYERTIRIEFALLGRIYIEDGDSVDECLTALRIKLLEPLGMVPLLNAARRNFHVSRMQRQMSRGATGYLLRFGNAARAYDQASIFEPCAPTEVCSVSEQAAFYKTWLSTLKD